MYESRKYGEFFEIDEGYYPEINPDSIKDEKNKWQYTFPHADIVRLLKETEKSLSRGDTEKKGIWIEGAYGTGKSRIIWTMQNLFDCTEEEFDAYFDEYDNLKKEIDLRVRLKTLRQGKVLTAYRYATGDITSTQKLIFAVFESLTASLKKRGLKFDGAKTLRGKISAWLEESDANFNFFSELIKKPEYRMSESFQNPDAEIILMRLKNATEVSQLVEDILDLGEREGILAFRITMQDLKNWITEVIAENKLQAIIFFWDEFSKFFGNNRNNLDEFQSLAELSNSTPFYLVIATHESESLAGEGDKAFRIVFDRFKHQEITMPDNIAFELIGHAMKVKDAAKNDWESISAALRNRTAEPRQVVQEFAKIRDKKILENIIPIHPMAAILLKNISTYFASNQRSMFNFIKNNDKNVKAFQDFIATKSPEDGDLLTIDYLWNFFYESGTDERGSSVGRMNLKPSIATILDSYELNKNNLTPDERAVLKTVLLFQAIEQETRGDVEIFKPTAENLKLAFTGVDTIQEPVVVANDLVRKEILFKKPGAVDTYASMSLGGDHAEIERLKKTFAENCRTSNLVESQDFIGEIKITAAQKFRYIFTPVTADNFTITINRITNEKVTYKINAVVCFARNAEEQNKLRDLISKAILDARYNRLVFIDASSNTMNRDLFDKYIDNIAVGQYWQGKDNSLSNQMKLNAENCIKEWRNIFESGYYVYYSAIKDTDKREAISLQNSNSIAKELSKTVQVLFKYSFDHVNVTDTLFLSTNLAKLASSGVTETEFSMLKANQIKNIFGDLWQISAKYWEVYPNAELSKLKKEIDNLITTEIDKNVRIAFDDIFAYLLEVGFMPCNLYACLTGFLLKEYAEDPYRYSAGIDGNVGGAMNKDKLAECIGECIKQTMTPTRSYRPKYIEIMSQNQRYFMNFATEIFGVDENNSVEQSAQKLRNKMTNLNCPFWCYVDAADKQYESFLQLVAEIANSKKAEAISTLSERAGELLAKNPKTISAMKKYLTQEKGKEIFQNFVTNFEGGELLEVAKKIGADDVFSDCLRRVTSGDGIWLRDKEAAEEDFKKLLTDYKIVEASQAFGINVNSFGACMSKWQETCKWQIKIPADVVGGYYSALKNFFDLLKETVLRGDIPQGRREDFLNMLIENKDTIIFALGNSQTVLKEKYSALLEGLSDADIEEIYSMLHTNAFVESQGQYYKKLQDLKNKIMSDKITTKLQQKWREVFGNKNPREWSREYRTPIFILVPDKEVEKARRVFTTILSNSPTEADAKFALNYLEKPPAYFKDFTNQQKIEDAFKKKIIGEFVKFAKNNDEVRDELESKFQGDAYDWYKNVKVNEILAQWAKNKYYSGGVYDQVIEKVNKMSSEDAKKLLIDLLDKNYEVGLKLLTSES